MANATASPAEVERGTVKPSFQFDRFGDEFAYAWPAHGIAVGFDQIREERGELYAEIQVKSTLPDQSGHIHWGRLNLSSTQSRDRLATMLSKRVKDIPWQSVLETACTKTAMEFRQDEPTVNLSTVACPADDLFLINPLLPEGEVSLLFGNGGGCKSLLAMAIAIITTTRGELPGGIQATHATNVMYCDWEAGLKNQARRLHWLKRGLGLSSLPDIQYRRPKRPIWEIAASLRAEVQRLKIGLLIIDSIGYACVPEDLNEASTALRAMAACRSLGTTVLVIAHVSKGNNDSKSRRTPFGSIFFENSARSQWEIRRAESTEFGVVNVGLFHSKVNDGPREDPIGLRFEFYGTSHENRSISILEANIDSDPELSQHTTLATRLRNLLRQGAMSTKELIDETQATAATIRNTLRRMPDIIQLDTGNRATGGARWGLKAS